MNYKTKDKDKKDKDKKDLTATYNIDCIEYMKSLPANFFDLAVVDPPYGINATKFNLGTDQHVKNKNKKWDSAIPSPEYFKLLKKVSKKQIIFGGNYFTKFLEPNNNWLIWYKNNDGVSFSMAEMAWTNTCLNTKVFDFRPMGKLNKIHPTQKPVELYTYILKTYAKPSYKILDTHLGSGSSRIAAYNLNFNFIGLEIDKKYFINQELRFAKHKKQLQMF